MQDIIVNTDCRYYKGDIPCRYHKLHQVHCDNCSFYDKIEKRILIIKLAAMGDVIRTTPILRKIKGIYPKSEITWLTYYPDFIPSHVDNVMSFTFENVLILKSISFDILYNFDKDKIACAVADQIEAEEKYGFGLKNGKTYPITSVAKHKWLTGLFDDLNINNRKSYVEEIFEMSGFDFQGERYILEQKEDFNDPIQEKRPLIGLNTGCGDMWLTRLWSKEKWITLAKALKNKGLGCIILGGPSEHEKNKLISKESGATYLGHFPIKKFIGLISRCDLIVTAVTMAMHIAIGLEKKLVLLNNIFNKYEFELYGLGEIIEPNVDCLGCFKKECNIKCLETIAVDDIINPINRLLMDKR